MARDSDFFQRRAAEARAAAFSKDDGEQAEVAGDLALAYAALARRRAAAAEPERRRTAGRIPLRRASKRLNPAAPLEVQKGSDRARQRSA